MSTSKLRVRVKVSKRKTRKVIPELHLWIGYADKTRRYVLLFEAANHLKSTTTFDIFK